MEAVTLVECPRDAMQGIAPFIPTELKIEYLNTLLQVGFTQLDFGSFVSPKAIPQLADTAQVVQNLDLQGTDTQLLAIVGNVRGAEAALQYPQISLLGYPFSLSETFQQRNTRQTIAEAEAIVAALLRLCQQHQRQLVVYLSMGFGNPYGDAWSNELVYRWAARLAQMGVTTLSLADTVGQASPTVVQELFSYLLPRLAGVSLGAHLHAHPRNWQAVVQAAWQAGCRRFDGALRGFGGCPFAEDELVGNLATENLIQFVQEQGVTLKLNHTALQQAFALSERVFAGGPTH